MTIRGRTGDPATLALGDRAALSLAETGRLLGVSPRTVWREVKRGRLVSVKVGRRRLISRAALDRYIARLDAGGGRGEDGDG